MAVSGGAAPGYPRCAPAGLERKLRHFRLFVNRRAYTASGHRRREQVVARGQCEQPSWDRLAQVFLPFPYSTRPGLAPVCSPLSITTTPLTMT